MSDHPTLEAFATKYREWLSKAAQENNLKLKDLLALTPSRDPFAIGTENQMKLAYWFRDTAMKYHKAGIHLRKLHYRVLSAGNAKTWGGRIYENTEYDWEHLLLAALLARYLRLVPPDIFPDKKVHDPIMRGNIRGDVSLEEIAEPENVLQAVHFYPLDRNLYQPCRIEIWVEKDFSYEIGDIPYEYGCNVILGEGQIGVTQVEKLFWNRILMYMKPTFILYISDFDGQGDVMPLAAARKIEYFHRAISDLPRVTLKHLALTKEQVEHYNLPRVPIKASDTLKDKFEAKMGTGAVEIDALEALYEGEIQRLLREAIEPYFDEDIDEKVREENTRIDEEIKSKLRPLIGQLKLDGLAIKKLASNFKLDLENDNWLYDSKRDYREQLMRYLNHKEGANRDR